MSTPHERALEAVRKYLLPGEVLEVTSKPEWGFEEIKGSVWVLNRFLNSWMGKHIDNIVLHILAGEGAPMDRVLPAIEKACRFATRVLILEHDPGSKDFEADDNVQESKIQDIQRTVFNDGYWGEWQKFDGRNMLLVLTTIKHIDETLWSIGTGELAKALEFQFEDGLPEKDRNIFCLSSERQPETDKLLDDYTVDWLDSLDKDTNVFMVTGGLMFLDFLAETKERDVILFDVSLPQILYAMMVVEIIRDEPSLECFDAVLAGTSPKADLSKLNTFINADILKGWLVTAESYVPRADKNMTWRNLVNVGRWREHYEQVRARILKNRLWYHWGDFNSFDARGEVLYTSTVGEEHWKHWRGKCGIIQAVKNRDVPMMDAEVVC